MFFAAAVLIASGQPAPSDVGVECILDQLPAAERSRTAQDALAGRPIPTVEQAIVACVERGGWDAGRAGTMAGLAMAILLRDDARARLSRAGIETAAIDRWFGQQSAEFRITPEIEPAAGDRLIAALEEEGMDGATLVSEGETIGVYLGARIMIERAERGLPLG